MTKNDQIGIIVCCYRAFCQPSSPFVKKEARRLLRAWAEQQPQSGVQKQKNAKHETQSPHNHRTNRRSAERVGGVLLDNC